VDPVSSQAAWRIVGDALELDPSERTAFVAQTCGSDETLREEVESLLHYSDDPRRFLPIEVATANPSEVPEQIGNYEIVGKLGEGGMGVVYEAVQKSPRREVALKVLRPMLDSESMRHRFEYEVSVLAMLQHPGIAHVYEAGSFDLGHGVQPFFAMELVDGQPLTEFAAEHGFDTRQRLELVAAICDAVHHAHQRGVIHRDLKPDNVLVTSAGLPKVLDFGIARALRSDDEAMTRYTMPGLVVGTLAYMSPEQLRDPSGDLATTSDVYSLGAMTYLLLCGQLPHDLGGKSLTESIRVITETDASPLGTLDPRFRGDVETIVGKALAKDTERRYQSAAELAADIRRFLAHEPIAARRPSTLYHLRKFARRNRGLVAGTLATMFAIVAGAIAAIMFAVRAAEQQKRAVTYAYRMSLRAAQDDLLLGRHRTTAAFLDDASERMRGWEWRYLRAQLEPWSGELVADTTIRGPLAYTPDGQRVLAVLGDGSIAAWNVRTKGLTRPFTVDGEVTTMTEGCRPALAAATSDGRVFLWPDGKEGTPEVLSGFESPIAKLVWARDRLVILTTGELWSWRDGVKTRIGPGSKPAIDLAASPDGSRVAFISNYGLRLVDLADGKARTRKHTSGHRAVSFSRDGRRLLVGMMYQNVHVLEVPTLKRLDADTGHDRATFGLRIAPDGATIASTSDEDGTLVLRDATTLRVLTVRSRGKPTGHLCFRPDGGQVAVADLKGRRITLWDLPIASSQVLGRAEQRIHSLGWSPAGDLLVIRGRRMQVLDSMTGERVFELAGGTPLAFSADSQRLLVGRTSYDLITGQSETYKAGGEFGAITEFVREHGGEPVVNFRSQSFAPDFSKTCKWSGKRSVISNVVAVPGGKLIAQVTGHRAEVWGSRFSRDGKLLLSASADRTVRIWQTEPFRLLHAVPAEKHFDRVFCGDFSPDGSRIATGADDNVIRIFDAKSYERLLELHGHRSYVAGVMFSPDGTRLASVAGDGDLRMWDSVPRRVRVAEALALERLRETMTPRVDRALAEAKGDIGAAAGVLRADPELSLESRAAALRVLARKRRARAAAHGK